MGILISRREDMFGKKQNSSRELLLAEINDAARAMEAARQHFNNADEDMLEACIYEMNAAKARYNGLVRKYKGSKK